MKPIRIYKNLHSNITIFAMNILNELKMFLECWTFGVTYQMEEQVANPM